MTPKSFKSTRIKYKLSQAQFAKALLVSERLVCYIERGERTITKRMENMINELSEKIIKKRLQD